MKVTEPLYALYANRLRHQVTSGPIPRHIGLIMDGNRRWARQAGFANPSLGHRIGAEHVEDLLAWCERLGIKHITVFVCSTENLQRRGNAEVAFLMQVIEDLAVALGREPPGRWQVHTVGTLDLLPDNTARALKAVAETTKGRGASAHLTLAIGYGGRQEVIDAIREMLRERASAGDSLEEVAADLEVGDITRHLSTAGRPDPDLVIRTSGEQRMSNFLLWQSAYAELYFCEAYWPAFREIDFLRAVRSFGARHRRHGT